MQKHDHERHLLLEEQEALRKHKDCEIAKMIKANEEARHKACHEISELKETILARDHLINEKNSQILSLQQMLNKKEDVE